ncbi:hypothetical protein [Parerythrobacter jejuensis]|uniref:Uncharacterized protein n=1 Tax=Parerythrobacter jejuensis TaxID=795812 RepID=A0A845AXF7_9SPHN|nr:hypothetical protein [Parerythrobacter jejuensis]MXP31207.1 hypothetical protein [Parerythrobacter jejuensis]MXP33967.1 hypothetical protein [Parerythrobacter jejuensis]
MIKPILSAFALAALAATPALAEDVEREPTKGEKKLAKLLEGREAGEPESCIRDRPISRFQVIDKTAIVYKIGRTYWVNYTRDPKNLDDSDTLVFRRFGSQVCKTDIVTTIDRFNGFYTGNVFLDDFVPYRKVESDG